MSAKKSLEAINTCIILWFPLVCLNLILAFYRPSTFLLTLVILITFGPLSLMQLMVLKSILEEIAYLNNMFEKLIKDGKILDRKEVK